MQIRPSETFWDELLLNNNKSLLENYNPRYLLIPFGLITIILIGVLKIYIWTGNSSNMRIHHKIEIKSSVVE